jgi:hypothetical protein
MLQLYAEKYRSIIKIIELSDTTNNLDDEGLQLKIIQML